MPFTPLHMGPGLAFKSAGGRHFSLMVFGFSQVATDLETLVHMRRGDPVLHTFLHNFVGAAVVAAGSVLVGRPACQWLLESWRPSRGDRLLSALRGPERISWTAAVAGAVVGTGSHVVLDAVMHRDMRPFAPSSDADPLLLLVSTPALHLGCVAAGLLGLAVLALRAARSGAAHPS